MDITALIGESGTGKSFKAMMIAGEMGIEYIIDDGLLIKGTKVLAGRSAKSEDTIVSAVKRALFIDEKHKESMINEIKNISPEKILIIGTSNKMVEKIARALELPQISEKIYIQDISTEEEIRIAKNYRNKEGKHVIPVPTFAIKKDFSGYFIDTLKIFKRKKDKSSDVYEKTVVRPTFSYMGEYVISHNVIKDLAKYAAEKTIYVDRVIAVHIKTKQHGIVLDLDIGLVLNKPFIPIVKNMQLNIISEIESMTSLNVLAVNVIIKKIKI